MSAYFIGVFAICACLGILGLISYDEKNNAERGAIGIILLYVVLSPIAENLSDINEKSFNIDEFGEEYIGSEYLEVGEAALCDGICLAVAESFSISEDNISVKLVGFDFNEMHCDTVRVLLSGKAITADSIAIKKFIEEMGVGMCEVEIEIGG